MTRSILVVAPYLPLPADFGGALRIYHLVRNLAADHRVTLLAPAAEADRACLPEMMEICDVTLVPARSTARQPAGRRKRVAQLQSLASGRSILESAAYSSQMQAVLDRLLKTRPFDLIQFEFPEAALYEVPAGIPTVFDAHNVEHELLARVARTSPGFMKQMFNQSESRKLRRMERQIWDRATVCVATSERDAATLRQLTSTPVDVVPNGVDLDNFSIQSPESGIPGEIVFTGAMRHQPNADGAVWFARAVLPTLRYQQENLHFSIVGADPPAEVVELASDAISVTGRVDDVRPYLQAAQVVVVPLHAGGGTRLKILEALASGRPVVSTSVGAEGLDVLPDEHLLIADSAEAFARAVATLLEDQELAAQLAFNGRALVESRYGWPEITQRLVAAHDRAIAISGG